MKYPFLKLALSAVMLGAVAVTLGCQTVTEEFSFGKRIDYKSAKSTPTLEVPPDLSQPQFDDRYAVASANEMAGRDVRAEARERTVLPPTDNVKLERAGTERWLTVKTTPAKAWDVARAFWIDIGFVFAEENPTVGTMETDWAENRADIPNDLLRRTVGKYVDFFYSTYKRDKFRTRIEKGKDPNTVEIYLSHRGMEQVPTTKIDNNTPAAFAWALMPPDPNLEAEMLMRLMVRFGATEERAKTEVIALVKETEPERARVVKENDEPRLIVNDSFDRAWRRVGLALDRVGFTVTDRNRAQGIYYVRYADPDTDIAKAKDEGFLSKLAFWRTKVDVTPENYQVNVAARNDTMSIVSVVSEKAPAQNADIEKMLAILQEQLK